MRKTKYSFLISAAVMASLVLSCQAAQADDNAAPVTNAQSTTAATTTPAEKQPAKVVSTKVDGEPDVNTTGIEVFDPVQVTVKTDH
jgi:predicted component of type VI protein secretion system